MPKKNSKHKSYRRTWQKSRALLKHYKTPGTFHCADLFSPPQELLEQFDLVVSFGVVEHFEDTAGCLKACSAFVKPGGTLLTVIPVLSGIIGSIQKRVDRAVYDVHVPLNKKEFLSAHNNAGLNVKKCDYFMSINLSVVNSGSFSYHPLNKYLRHILSASSKIFWALEKYGVRIPKNGITSPYLISVARI